MNKVVLMGRLTRSPEVRYSQGAEPLAVARYTLAVNRRMKKNGNGEQEADFIPCVAFGKSGEFAEKYFRKGQMVAVTGRLQVRSWDKDGERRYTTEVIIEEQHFAESKNSQPAAAEQGRKDTGEGKAAKENGQAPADGFYPINEGVEDEDLPF
ncbi:single-stranded DNA-binding protein [Firmicutes bacterium AM29-6AC]|uniref:Single-stranded DNA-binding protein n=1 Tax=Anaerotignum faecicola TaxID=2358141 RepID=A0A401LG93_9FIRM|nr:single-stranded DNA-binding protein [Anaerotignum faecicola]RHR15152.1 single-stranded DNA-binding protein [Firmicutes bacterium AF19-2LB]RHT39098.1 single-stranded DNA-binding protein [Firmicutes bacterium AM29-6AC]GCB30527.1 single-stranded DNA-binding protein [Anaerotignum faecicola]